MIGAPATLSYGLSRRGVLGVLGAATVTACSPGTSGGGTRLRVGDQLEYLQAIFKASGQLPTGTPYQIDWSNFVSGPAVISAGTGGSIDVGWTASTPLVFAQAAGTPVKIVGAFDAIPAADGRAGMGILVRSDSPIRSLADLKGKRVSYALGTITQYITLEALGSVGLGLNDITPVLSTVERAAPLLENGHTDALVAVEPILSRLVSSGAARVLARAVDHTRELHFVVAPESALENAQTVDFIGDFFTRMARALAWWGENPEAAARETMNLYRVPRPVAEVIARHIVRKAVPITPDIIAFQQKQADAFLAAGQISRTIDVNALVDRRFDAALSATAETSDV